MSQLHDQTYQFRVILQIICPNYWAQYVSNVEANNLGNCLSKQNMTFLMSFKNISSCYISFFIFDKYIDDTKSIVDIKFLTVVKKLINMERSCFCSIDSDLLPLISFSRSNDLRWTLYGKRLVLCSIGFINNSKRLVLSKSLVLKNGTWYFHENIKVWSIC